MNDQAENGDAELELNLLGGITSLPSEFEKISQILKVEDFSTLTAQQIFMDMSTLKDSESQITIQGLIDLTTDNNIEEIYSRLKPTSAPDVIALAKSIRNRAVRRALAKYSEPLNKIEINDSGEILKITDKQLNHLVMARDRLIDKPEKETSMTELLGQYCLGNDVRGGEKVLTGYKNLDRITEGMARGALVICMAKTSQGKTTMALNIALNVAEKNGMVVILQYEQSAEEMVEKVCQWNGVEGVKHWGSEGMNDKDRSEVHKIQRKEWVHNLKLLTPQNLEVNWIGPELKRICAKEMRPIDLVVVDYAQLLMVKGKELNSNIANRLDEIANRLKALARETNCPILCLSQVRRNKPQDKDVPLTIEDLKGSSGLEQAADQIWSLEPVNVKGGDSQVQIKILKARTGERGGSCRLAFLKHRSRFTEIDQPSIDEF